VKRIGEKGSSCNASEPEAINEPRSESREVVSKRVSNDGHNRDKNDDADDQTPNGENCLNAFFAFFGGREVRGHWIR
jgi:hypothetical protein